MPSHATSGSAASDHAEVIALRSAIGAPIEVMRTWYRTQSFPRHTHEYFTVGVMLRGVGTLWSRGVTHTARRGDVVIIPPGEVHTGGLGGTNDGVMPETSSARARRTRVCIT